MSMNTKLFGTDGIRGKAGQFPVQPNIILKVGQAMGVLLKKKNKTHTPMVLIGKDTRLSGYMLEQALASGLNSMGIWVQLTGPLPTPGISFLARNMRADAGVVISASHNQYQDNGIKFFNEKGFKLSKEMEQEIEELVFSDKLDSFIAPSDQIGRSRRIDDATGRYIVYVKNVFPLNHSLEKFRIVLDCANGAAYKVAPTIFKELGAEVIVLGNNPDGYNINYQSGALFPEKIKEAVLKYKADVGISLDGDGDRVVMVDENGDIVDGDHILGICALHLQKTGQLEGDKVVSTHMSNAGLERMLKEKDIEFIRTEVGDRNVVEQMQNHNISLGGEPSGHIIFLKQNTTGDGLVGALNVLAVMVLENKKLSTLKSVFSPLPQQQISIRIQKEMHQNLSRIPGYTDLVNKITKKLHNTGRLYVRFSGTEPVLRVLLEGEDKVLIQKCAEELKNLLDKNISDYSNIH